MFLLEAVEPLFNKIKQCRRIATRHDKPAANCPAFVKLASIRLWLKSYISTASMMTTRRKITGS